MMLIMMITQFQYMVGTNLRILSRVSDKESGDVGNPVQCDSRLIISVI